ncbi:MAG: GNAT family N-acetyltransferase [Thermoleophilia bacterium]
MGPSAHPSWNVAQRLRLAPETIDSTLEEVHALLRDRGRSACTWEVGSSATPSDLVDRLRARGLVDDSDPYVVGMVLADPPPATSEDVEARPVRDFEEFRAAQRVAEEAFGGGVGMDDDQLLARYEEKLATGGWKTFVALVDGEIVGSASSTYLEGAVTLNGGAVLPDARRRGAYRALVAARWADAVERGTPSLVTQAGAMSKPILERLGFRQVAEITILLDEFGA